MLIIVNKLKTQIIINDVRSPEINTVCNINNNNKRQNTFF